MAIKKESSPKLSHIYVRIDPKLKAFILRQCKETNRSISNYITFLLLKEKNADTYK